MPSIANIFTIVEADQAGDRRIIHITVSPEFWHLIQMSVREVWTTVSGFAGYECDAAPAPINLLGVPLEIDELQAEEWILWSRSEVFAQ